MHRITAVAAGALLGMLAIFASAVPASAHDQLIESTPGADAQLADPPSEVRLRFSAELMDVGAAVLLVDADGADHAGELQIDGDTVTAPVTDLTVGGYQVRWRVVSSDGHPISGIIPFTVGDAQPLPMPTAGSTEAGEGGTDVEGQSATEDDTALRVVLLATGGAVIAAAASVVITSIRRRSRRDAPDAEALAPSDTERKTNA